MLEVLSDLVHKGFKVICSRMVRDMPWQFWMRKANVILVNNDDLLPYVDSGMEASRRSKVGLNFSAERFPILCKTGEGLDAGVFGSRRYWLVRV